MLLFVGIIGGLVLYGNNDNVSVNILDTEDMVVESIKYSRLMNLLDEGAISIGNYNELRSWFEEVDGKAIIPEGLYVKLGCGDIWFASGGVLYIWNSVLRSAFRLKLSIIRGVATTDEEYAITYTHLGFDGAVALKLPLNDTRGYKDKSRGVKVDKDIFIRKGSLGVLNELWRYW